MKRLFIIFLILLLICVLAFIIVDHFFGNQQLTSQQKAAALENLLGRPAQLSDKKAIQWREYKSTYFSVTYPEDANILPKSSSSAFLDSFSYSLVSDHILVTIAVRNVEGSLAENSGVMARISQPDIYTATESSRQNCLVFIKSAEDGSEKSLFCLVNGRVGSFVVSGPNDQKVTAYFSDILPSISW